MINSFIAFNQEELNKKIVLSEAKNLFNNKILSEEQWNQIQVEFNSKIYTPNLIIRVLFFILSLIGMSTIMGPIALIFGELGESGYQLLSFVLGVSLIMFTELFLIKSKNHFKSGVTEAGIYLGLTFLTFAILGFEGHHGFLAYYSLIFVLSVIATIRYLNLTAMLIAVVFFGLSLFELLFNLGGIFKTFIPFIFMFLFILIYLGSKSLQKKIPQVVFKNHFILLQTLTLILIFISCNYFVVRELSLNMLSLKLSENQDIPFAYLFYALTALIPLTYIYFGIKNKSILLIRVSLLTLVLSVITFKYYFSLGKPVVSITLTGAFLIIIALLLFKYLKQSRNGFIKEKLLSDKWNSPNMFGFIVSQTLGGQPIDKANNNLDLGGGESGGGGVGENW